MLSRMRQLVLVHRIEDDLVQRQWDDNYGSVILNSIREQVIMVIRGKSWAHRVATMSHTRSSMGR